MCAKEQIGICGSIVDEEIGYRAVQQSDAWLAQNDRAVREAFAVLKAWMAQEERLEWVEPSGGGACFPRLRDSHGDTAKFHARMSELGVFVGPGHWFEQSDRYFRLGYGWPTLDELRGGSTQFPRRYERINRFSQIVVSETCAVTGVTSRVCEHDYF